MTTGHAQREAVDFVLMVVVDEQLEEGLAYDTVSGFESLAGHGDASSDLENILWRRNHS